MSWKMIFISAGHSAVDPGAVANGVKEADLALRLRDALAAELRNRGLIVIEDGRDGQNLPLLNAINLAKGVDGDKVEIHFNAAANKNATGCEALAMANRKQLAKDLAGAIGAATGLVLRGESGYRDQSVGQHHRLAFCQMGGVILEPCFLTNKSDVQTYLANERQVTLRLADVLERRAKL